MNLMRAPFDMFDDEEILSYVPKLGINILGHHRSPLGIWDVADAGR